MIKTKILLTGLAQRLSETSSFNDAYFFYRGYLAALHKYNMISTSTLKQAHLIMKEMSKFKSDNCIRCGHKLNDYFDSCEGKICPQCFNLRTENKT
jgi:hypothetical protein